MTQKPRTISPFRSADARTVELRYEPRSLQVGMVISGIAALVVMGIFAFGAWSRVR